MSAEASLEHFRAAYAAAIALAVAVQFPAHARWVPRRASERAMPRLLGVWAMPQLGLAGFTGTAVTLVAGLAAGALDRWTGPALLAAAMASLLYFAQVIDLPTVRRKPNTVPIILLLLAAAAFAPGRAEWCLLLIKLAIAQIYLSSALAKLRQSGLAWAEGSRLRMTLLRYRLRDGSRAAEWLARRPAACRAASGLVFAFELTFWLVIPFPALAWVWLPIGVAFHAGTAVLMRIHYWIYLVPAYFVFFCP